MRKIMLAALATAVLALVVAPKANASVSGSQGFSTPALTQAMASPTGNINTSTLFELEGFSSTGNSTGIFTGLLTQQFGNVPLNIAVGTGFKFGNSVFGNFDSRTITTASNVPGFLNLVIEGTFVPGTFEPAGTKATPAEFRISFTQTPPMHGEISMSGTMSTQAVSVVPEPPAIILFGSGLVAMLGLLAVPKLRQKLERQQSPLPRH